MPLLKQLNPHRGMNPAPTHHASQRTMRPNVPHADEP